ncbi:MAG: S49 family peptidase [candidate division KSB1 bacterium]|nr:S49 family peptidase [candidate division KSB1 bacterium]
MRARTLAGLGAALLALLSGAASLAQSRPPAQELLSAPVSILDHGLLGLLNPANVAFLPSAEVRYYGWAAPPYRRGLVVAAFPGIGFASGHVPGPEGARPIHAVWMGSRGRLLGFGAGYQWQEGVPRKSARLLTGGTLIQPNGWLSLAAYGGASDKGDWEQRALELAVRPFADERLSLGVSYVVPHQSRWRRGSWFAGALLRPAPGVSLGLGLEERSHYRVALTLQAGPLSLSGGHVSATDRTVYAARIGRGRRADLASALSPRSEIVKIELRGKLDYLRYTLFDRGTHRLLDLIRDLQLAENDPHVGAVALHLSGAAIPAEMSWELRTELLRLRSAGKRVAVFLDEGDIISYWLATGADLVVMDPEGQIQLSGFVTGRTYLKHALEKLGLGFQELRFFRYKSAAETYANDRFSEADREQRSAYLDDVYETVRQEVCTGRGWTPARFDSLVDYVTIFLAEDAVRLGLVDTVGRWRDLDSIVAKKLGRRYRAVPLARLRGRVPADTWGPTPRIAVVYALGPCDLDTGIRARYLERILDQLARRRDIRAVVFRVDSPGGLIVPSDMVAQALRRCREKKPVVVTQGSVAGSGGYWISALGDTILSSPLTITGSIGVIGGWLYDKGFGEKLGLTSDFVKRGEHADLQHGVTVPFLGVTVPHRPLTEEEFGRLREGILQMYAHFVKLVAQARKLSEDSVRVIGEGRIYSGLDAVQIGIVDRIGTFSDALELARRMAGIPPNREVEILEFPRTKGFFPPVLGAQSRATAELPQDVLWFVRTFAKHQAQPLAILAPDLLPLDPAGP